MRLATLLLIVKRLFGLLLVAVLIVPGAIFVTNNTQSTLTALFILVFVLTAISIVAALFGASLYLLFSPSKKRKDTDE